MQIEDCYRIAPGMVNGGIGQAIRAYRLWGFEDKPS